MHYRDYYKPAAITILTLVAGLVASAGLWQYRMQQEQQAVNQLFLGYTKEVQSQIVQRVAVYEQLLRGLKGLFGAADEVTEHEWQSYIQTLNLGTGYEDMTSLGFALAVNEKTKKQFPYKIWTPVKKYDLSQQQEFAPIYHLIHFKERKDPYLGMDLMSDALVREALSAAQISNAMAVVNKWRPFYNNKNIEEVNFSLVQTVDRGDHEKRIIREDNSFYGYLYINISLQEFLEKIMYKYNTLMDLRISVIKDGRETFFYDTQLDDAFLNNGGRQPLFHYTQRIAFGNSLWVVEYDSKPGFERLIDSKEPFLTLLSAVLISILCAMITWYSAMTNMRSKALRLSNRKISDLNKELETRVAMRTSELEKANNALEKSNYLKGLKNELLNLLSSCGSVKETFLLSGEFFKRFFQDQNGRLYLHNKNNRLLELISAWGELSSLALPTMREADCLGLRFCRSHWVSRGELDLLCPHVTQENTNLPFLCVPVFSQETVFGLIVLDIGTQSPDSFLKTLESIAHNMALSCLNLDLKEKLQYDAIHDVLTGLYNRRYFEASLFQEIMRSKRADTPFVIIMIDIDDFKRINDNFGHAAGDHVLKTIADEFKHVIRASDVVCRFGGEEFLLLLETTLPYGFKRTEQLRHNIEALSMIFQGQNLGKITLSSGIAAYPDHGDAIETLIHAADQALYEAKKAGKNRTVIYERKNNNR